MKHHIFEAFLGEPGSDSHFRHINIYGGPPVCAALALLNIHILEQESLPEQVAEMCAYLLEQLQQLLDRSNVGDVRGNGLLLGIERVKDKDSKAPLDGDSVGSVIRRCMDQQIIIGRNTKYYPPDILRIY